ncbi:peptidase MA family metallohydrolase [Glaciecola sp. SC05]|uniref:peptidase MA family metallohydrolase n=1 Tax=Glaciecola sp. SC05 TaxID=1987355 RepID=UPI003528D01F
MKTKFADKIAVIIYPDIKEFHKAINFEDAPDWVVGAAGKNLLMMVSPLNPGKVHNYESLMKSIIHELCHAVVLNMREQGQVGLPKWLDEGFAFYYAKQLTETNERILVNSDNEYEIPSWEILSNAGTVEFGDKNGYIFSALIVEFLISNYGYDAIRKLIIQPNDFEAIFGLSELELESKWRTHLRNSHKGG